MCLYEAQISGERFSGPLVLWFLSWNHLYLNNMCYLGLTFSMASDLRAQCPRVGLGVKI